GDSRLVSYAVDISVEGERQAPSSSSLETSYSLKRGVLLVTRKERQETTYNFKSQAEKGRKILIEHPFNADFKLVSPEKPAERTPALYRFAVDLPAGRTQSLKVVLDHPIQEQFGIKSTDTETVIGFAGRKTIPSKLRDALQEVVKRRKVLEEVRAEA